MITTKNYKPAPAEYMGIIKDTPNVFVAETSYNRELVGYSARWGQVVGDVVRVYIWAEGRNGKAWVGPFELKLSDVERI